MHAAVIQVWQAHQESAEQETLHVCQGQEAARRFTLDRFQTIGLVPKSAPEHAEPGWMAAEREQTLLPQAALPTREVLRQVSAAMNADCEFAATWRFGCRKVEGDGL